MRTLSSAHEASKARALEHQNLQLQFSQLGETGASRTGFPERTTSQMEGRSDCRPLMGRDHISTENLVFEQGRDLYHTEIKTYTLVEKLLSLIHLLAQGPERKQRMGTAMPFIQFLTMGAFY